jgi:hypothetical protein
VIVLLIVLGLVALGLVTVLKSDSRDYDDRDRRGWWPGAYRR